MGCLYAVNNLSQEMVEAELVTFLSGRKVTFYLNICDAPFHFGSISGKSDSKLVKTKGSCQGISEIDYTRGLEANL